MIIVWMILGIVTTGSCIPLQGPEYKSVSSNPDFGYKEWTPIARGQFMREILFGIHPHSPLNRDAWAKSGYRTLLENRHEPSPKAGLGVKTTPQLMRKPTLLGLSIRKRIPKHVLATSSTPFVGNGTEITTEAKLLTNIVATPIIPFPIPRPAVVPPPNKRANVPEGQTKSVQPRPRSMGRCLIQSVGIQPQTRPNFFYPVPILLPMTPTQFGFAVYPPPLPSNANFPITPKLIQQQSSPIGFAYTSMQNRLPYPLREQWVPDYQHFYNAPPLDLLAMEGKRSPNNIYDLLSKDTKISPKTINITFYHNHSPKQNASSQELISSKNDRIFIVPSLQAEVIVSSEAQEESEIKQADHATGTDKEFRAEPETVAKDVQTVKEDQLVVDVQEPTTQEIPFVTSTQREQPTEGSTLLLA